MALCLLTATAFADMVATPTDLMEPPVIEEAEPEEQPVEEQPVEEQPAEEQPIEEQPAEEQPVEEQPAEEQPVEEQPAEEQPVEEQPVEEQPVEEQLTESVEWPGYAAVGSVTVYADSELQEPLGTLGGGIVYALQDPMDGRGACAIHFAYEEDAPVVCSGYVKATQLTAAREPDSGVRSVCDNGVDLPLLSWQPTEVQSVEEQPAEE